ncbi:molybdate ABC transporter substrate-binding protein [Marinimicrobium alkaliphilum]|uniref:molybdate ABC transporter substrate-binding protein n=1 Tax=Marinimicrobium alkaliphilum TaxID=2202654 RepID=UPI000DB97F06|nr:molybdate ABC transporter substrate-binding protein [Marinimicrobium alkaliphilum]
MCRSLLLSLVLLLAAGPLAAREGITVAAASDLRYALDDILELYLVEHPQDQVQIIYGSSGKMTTQIIHGAPFDVFFSADIAFPERLKARDHTATDPSVYALGRIVIWSRRHGELELADLAQPHIRRVAIAQPSHAPYGARAQEALQASGLWEQVQPKLVFGENIAHAAQMAASGAADAGIIALSLALFPELAENGYTLIDDALHETLTQSFVITRHGADKATAHRFANFMGSEQARAVMTRYGFVLPEADS